MPGWWVSRPGWWVDRPGWSASMPGWWVSMPGWWANRLARWASMPGWWGCMRGLLGSMLGLWVSTLQCTTQRHSSVRHCQSAKVSAPLLYFSRKQVVQLTPPATWQQTADAEMCAAATQRSAVC